MRPCRHFSYPEPVPLLFLLGLFLAQNLHAESAPLLNILSSELERNYNVLKQKADPPTYFLAYSVVEEDVEIISGTLGALQSHTKGHERLLDVTLRVGSPKLDNYRSVNGDHPQFTSGSRISLEEVPDALKRQLWLETDRVYRGASQKLINLKTNNDAKVAAEDKSDDYSLEAPSSYVEPFKKLSGGGQDWEAKVRRWSAELTKYPDVLASTVTVVLQRETKYLVNSEGTRLLHGRGFARVLITAEGKASDGMDLATSDTFEADDATGLPAEATVIASAARVANDLHNLLNAPPVDPVTAPAILSGKAAGVFFHEIFGHRVEGHRQKDTTDGQTFTKSVNTKVLPDFLSVYFDPTIKRIGSMDLYGTYLYDDEGVKARRVGVVENGVLKTFLMSRSPIEGFPRSNGHGRRQAGNEVVSRQSNLIVESQKSVTDAQLRQTLIGEIKKQNKPYGFFFRDITGGFTFTGRRGLQAFKVIPLVVYRVYPDGRPDELVRGVDIVGTPLASFSRILATADKPEVFNGYCGAESGSVPVSAVSPAILVSEIEIQRKSKGDDRPPLLAPPSLAGGIQ